MVHAVAWKLIVLSNSRVLKHCSVVVRSFKVGEPVESSGHEACVAASYESAANCKVSFHGHSASYAHGQPRSEQTSRRVFTDGWMHVLM